MRHSRRWVGISVLVLWAGSVGLGCSRKRESESTSLVVKSEKESTKVGAQKAIEKLPVPGEACPSWDDVDPTTLSPIPSSPYAPTFLALWDKIRTRHHDPTLNCLDWVSLREEYGAKLAGVTTREDAYDLYNSLLGQLEQSHLLAIAPRPLVPQPSLRLGPAVAPVHWQFLNDQVFIRAARPGESRHRSITTGKIVAIDDVDIETLLHSIESDAIASSVERARVIARALSCPEGGEKSIRLKRTSDAPAKDYKVECELPAAATVSIGNLRNVETEVRSALLDSEHKIAYLAFNVWMLPMVRNIGHELETLKAQGMRSLVLDLRGNRGGIATMTIPVARMLWPEGGSLGTLKMRDFSQELLVRPEPKAFGGPIVLLLDDESASTSEIFALGMRAAKRVHIVGPSGSAGMALPSIIEGLPDGGLLQYVVGQYVSPIDAVAEGKGVIPDDTVTIDEETLVAGRDPVLEKALDILRTSSDSDAVTHPPSPRR